MDIKDMFGEKFRNLSREEKEKVARELLNLSKNSKAAPMTCAAFLNPETGMAIAMEDLVDKFGEDKAIDFIIEALENVEKAPQGITKTDYEELVKKANRGEASKEEIKILEFITDELEKKDNMKFGQTLLDFTVNLINFVQNTVGYELKLEDITSLVTLLTIMSNLHNGGSLSCYTENDFDMLSKMTSDISKDIFDTWKASCKSLPSPELTIIALMKLITNIAHDNNIKIGDAVKIADSLGFELSDEDFDDDEEEDEISYENENGSNKMSDKEKRNFLKED